MKIQPSAPSQTTPANGGATGRNPQSGGAFDDALAGVDGGSPGSTGATGADPTAGKPALAGMNLSASTTGLLAELTAAAANANGAPASGLNAGLPQASLLVAGASTTPQASAGAPTKGTPLATWGDDGMTPPDPADGADVDATIKATAPTAAFGMAALAGTATSRRSSGAADQATTAPAGTGPVTPSADLLAVLSAAVVGGATGSVTGKGTAGMTTAPSSPPAGSGSTGRIDIANALDPSAADSAKDPADSGSKLLLSDISIESHIAPADTKVLGSASSGKLVASAVATSATLVDAEAMTPTRTIANAVVSLASQAASSSTAVAVPNDVTASAPAAARTMTLQLSPANLGTVSVRLHVTGQTLDVELSLSNQQTLGLVSRERDVLASALRSQNYDLNTLVIQGADANTGTSGDQYVPNHRTGSGGDTSSGDGRSASGNGNGSGQQASTGSDRQPDRGEAGAADRGVQRGDVDALFV